MLKNTLVSAVCVSATALAINAHAVQIGKPITITVPTNQHGLLAAAKPKQVTLMNLQLSAEQRKVLNSYHPAPYSLATQTDLEKKLPSQVALGMNDVPVLDQGQHGTCVTFAETAAVNAVLGKGDYVSQLCSLELGNTLEKDGYWPSGWDGSFGPWVLEQLLRFGVVTQADQKAKSCAGMKEYPTYDQRNNGSPMSLDDYRSMSEDLNERIYVDYLMNFDERFDSKFTEAKVNKVFNEVKEALNNGNRVTFGTLLIIPPGFSCVAGACAKHNVNNDTWALTSELDNPNSGQGGHEMVITGYDDNAVAVDKDGNKHQGLFTLRNSWGDDIGDNGDFYMTYDYFKKYAGEAQAVVAR